jgi:tetratricopeptide (TPR) repeat protein
MLASSGDDASSNTRILRAVQKVSVDLRSKLGESLKSVQKYDKPLELTTSSFDALRALSMARKSRRDGKRTEQIAWLRRAVEFDPSFAYGYAALSVDAWNRRQHDQAAEYARRAFDLREQATEREKFYIMDKYYGNATGQLEEQIQSARVWASVYPRDYSALASLCTAYGVAGQYEKGLQAALDAIRIDPDAVTPYGNAMGYYAAMGRFDDAKRMYDEARNRQITYGHLPVYYYDVAFIRHDAAAMQQAVAESLKNDAEDEISLEMALVEAYYGRMQKAAGLIDRVLEAARRTKNEAGIARAYAGRAHLEAIFGLKREAQKDAAAALPAASSPEMLASAGWALARAGDLTQAAAIEKQLEQRYPLHTIVNRVFLPILRAEMANARNRPQEAIAALESARPYELTSTGETRNLYAIYLRGESHLWAHEGQAALQEFQKILDAPGIVMNSPLMPLSRLGVARAYAELHDPRTRDKYVDFFTIWNEADSDLPIVLAARREYTAIR